MKKIKLIMAVAVGTALFTGCKKDGMQELGTPDNAVAASQNMAKVTYNVKTVFPTQNSILQWNTGVMTVNGLLFQATQINGNVSSGVAYKTPVNQRIDLFNPVVMGTLVIPMGTYDHAIAGVSISGGSSVPSLLLSGYFDQSNFDSPGKPMADARRLLIRVQVIVQEPLILHGLMPDPVMLTFMRPYSATLLLDLSQVTAGITADMLNNAVSANKTIVISADSNRGLYQMILNNLQNMMKAQLS